MTKQENNSQTRCLILLLTVLLSYLAGSTTSSSSTFSPASSFLALAFSTTTTTTTSFLHSRSSSSSSSSSRRKNLPMASFPLLMTSNDSSPIQQTNNDKNENKNQQQQQQQQQEPLPLSMELTKPLGLILEEVQENQPMGVKVQELSKEGSAYAKEEYRNVLVGMKLSQVMDVNVSNMSFENVMDCIIQAPSPLRLSFVPLLSNKEDVKEELDVDAKDDVMFPVGTTVEIRVLQSDKEDKILQAKVGDNLRKVLLDNQVELYRGLKKKLGNCGGGGQCTFCAVDFIQEEGWGVRSEYETQKIGKKLSQTARLACLNNVQGPATIRVE